MTYVMLFVREKSERGGTEIGAAPLLTSSGKRSIDQCTNPWRARIPAALTHTATSVGLFVNCFIDSIGSVG
jgi:hypothetical protein